EMLVDWKITKKGDSGIYLRGSPQIQIWDTSRTEVGAQVGSGGLYNNQKNISKPLVVADNPVGEWNAIVIECRGDEIRVWVNGDLVNHGTQATASRGQIAVQAEGSEVEFRRLQLIQL
nr:DUF1080 domain-containing protein [Cyclobacteriaceae bacterium]